MCGTEHGQGDRGQGLVRLPPHPRYLHPGGEPVALARMCTLRRLPKVSFKQNKSELLNRCYPFLILTAYVRVMPGQYEQF